MNSPLKKNSKPNQAPEPLKVEEYQILSATGASGLEGRVNGAIAQGWIPVGGVTAVASPGGGGVIYQALVKPKQ